MLLQGFLCIHFLTSICFKAISEIPREEDLFTFIWAVLTFLTRAAGYCINEPSVFSPGTDMKRWGKSIWTSGDERVVPNVSSLSPPSFLGSKCLREKDHHLIISVFIRPRQVSSSGVPLSRSVCDQIDRAHYHDCAQTQPPFAYLCLQGHLWIITWHRSSLIYLNK